MQTRKETHDIAGFNMLIIKNMIGEVVLLPGPAGKCSVEIEAQDDLVNLFKLGVSSGTRFNISGPKSRGIQTNNDVTTLLLEDGSQVVVRLLPKVKVTVPLEILVDFNGRGVGVLAAAGLNSSFRIETNGSFKIDLSATSDLDIETNGVSEIKLLDIKGGLEVETNGSSSISADGQFSDIKLEMNGSGLAKIAGDCNDCGLEINGVGTIEFTGHVRGSLSKSANPSFTSKVIVNLK